MDAMLAHKTTADEWFEFHGHPEFGKPAYWVARTGTTVIERVDVRDPRVCRYGTVEVARAQFAEAACDPTVGAPTPGDVIRILYGDAEGDTFTVESMVAVDGRFEVTGNRSGQPLRVDFGQYRIVSRPVAS